MKCYIIVKIRQFFLQKITYITYSNCIVYANEISLPKLIISNEEYSKINPINSKYIIRKMVITNRDNMVFEFYVNDLYDIAYRILALFLIIYKMIEKVTGFQCFYPLFYGRIKFVNAYCLYNVGCCNS